MLGHERPFPSNSGGSGSIIAAVLILGQDKARMAPHVAEPVIGPRFARTRWLMRATRLRARQCSPDERQRYPGFAKRGEVVPHDRKLAVIGLGYVGLPVAAAFARQGAPVIGFDIDADRIARAPGRALTARGKSSSASWAGSLRLDFADPRRDRIGADFFIVTVPTPIDAARRPDLSALLLAPRKRSGGRSSKAISSSTNSTVYPGATEEDCVPVLERASGLVAGPRFHRRLFARAHQPRRQGAPLRDHQQGRRPGRTERTLDIVAAVYGSVVTAGIHGRPRSRWRKPPR